MSLSRLGKQLGSLGGSFKSSVARRGGQGKGGKAAEDGNRGGDGDDDDAHARPSGILVGGASAEEDEREAVLHSLATGYFDPPQHFDALEHELRRLPVNFEAAHLEEVAEERTGVLEVRPVSAV